MAINLKPVDVAVVGLGAAGGVAVLPLARAGLKVAGIEAGTWMDPAKDFKPDEIHNNVRGLVTTVPKAKKEIPTFRTSPDAQARQAAAHPMMNAVGGTSIHYHAQSWRLKPWDFKTRSETDETLRREYASQGIDAWRTGPSVTTNWSRTTTSWSTRSAFRARRATSRASSIRRAMSTKAHGSANIRCLPLRTCDFLDHMHKAALSLGWKPFHAPAAINSQPYRGRGGLRLPRLLRSRRVPRPGEEFHLLHHHSGSAENQEPDGVRQRAGDAHRCRTTTAKSPVYFTSAKGKNIFSRPKWCWCRPTPTRTRGCCCFRNPRRIRTAWRTITARWASTISATGTRRRAWVSRRCSPWTSTPGTARCSRKAWWWTNGPTTLSIIPGSGSSAAPACARSWRSIPSRARA